ncbi:hypothetical protein [Azospirillum formosense]|uniref:hypothetical protein n=1 Tax=Azospirillum formosense TaxID=861533 RepID=UPI00338DA461
MRTTSMRVRRMPSFCGACRIADIHSFIAEAVDFPDPSGPWMQSSRAVEFNRNCRSVSPSGL